VKPVTIHEGAEADLRDGITYYNDQRAGLGGELRAELELALTRIQENPLAYAMEDDEGTRFCPLHRFPYSIVYLDLEDAIWVAAVVHHRRRPRYWAGRLMDR
jgi:toxin ParE1/3/4